MKPLNNKVAILPDFDDKQYYTFSTGDTIKLETQYNENLRERNQQTGVVFVDDEKLGLKKGDKVVVQHFQFMDHSGNLAENVLNIDDQLVAFVPDYEIYYKIENDEMVPLGEFLICKEVPMPQLTTSLDLTFTDLSEPKMEDLIVEVVSVNSKNTLGLNPGDKIVLLEVYCKYKIVFKGEEYCRVREEEVVATIG